jgi:hypothetical protein
MRVLTRGSGKIGARRRDKKPLCGRYMASCIREEFPFEIGLIFIRIELKAQEKKC